MELWIRSQDKTRLMKLDYLQIIYAKEDKELPYYINASFEHLGAYKTKERALEVLNEIQNILKPKGIIKFDGFLSCADAEKIKEKFDNNYLIFNKDMELLQQVETYVYQMPEE